MNYLNKKRLMLYNDLELMFANMYLSLKVRDPNIRYTIQNLNSLFDLYRNSGNRLFRVHFRQ